MKLVYLWIENHKDIIKNQSFNISGAYDIRYDVEYSRLHIIRNVDYIENFYGKNILDVTAIVGSNGSGKTTLSRFLYDYCEGVRPYDDEYNGDDMNHIIVYEKCQLKNETRKLIVQYNLSEDLKIDEIEGVSVESVNLKNMKKEKLEEAEKEHDITTVYFTNAFEISNVMNNQGLSEFSIWGVHKSLCYTPMLSLQRAYKKLENHYGAESIHNGMLLDIINQYAQKMTGDFKIPYATSVGYNFLIATRCFPGAIARILPVMKEFKLNVTEFGDYIKFGKRLLKQSPFDQTVMFIRKNIYEHLAERFKGNQWEEIYLNILCEIVLFLNQFNGEYINVSFEVFEEENINIGSEEALEKVLGKISDSDENKPKKELIRRIRNVQCVDLDIITDFTALQDNNMLVLKETRWYKQVQNFGAEYNRIKSIEVNQTIDYGFTQLIELIIDSYNDKDKVYGRMFSIVPQPMSSGESAMINIFATVYSALKKNTSGSILLILDEIDAFLHPKWQQEILMHITRWINESEEFVNKKVQLIVATHSPIILSDIPQNNIIYLNKLSKIKYGVNPTFGASIGTLFYNSFAMKKGSIGEIARKEIQWVIDNIDNGDLDIMERKRLVYIIDNMGDKFLREKLKSYPLYIETTAGSRGINGKD